MKMNFYEKIKQEGKERKELSERKGDESKIKLKEKKKERLNKEERKGEEERKKKERKIK